MARQFGKLETILSAIVARLIDQLPEAIAANTYINIDPDVVGSNPGAFVFVVAPAGGKFSEAMMDGGGQQQLTCEETIIVKCHSTKQTDQVGHAEQMLLNASTGLIILHTKILKALACWDPLNGSGDEQLRNPLLPGQHTYQRAGGGAGQGPRSYAAVEQVFVADFDWDMS